MDVLPPIGASVVPLPGAKICCCCWPPPPPPPPVPVTISWALLRQALQALMLPSWLQART